MEAQSRDQGGARTALLVGGAGFVGRLVAAALMRRGWRVAVGSRRPARARRALPPGDPGQVETFALRLGRPLEGNAALEAALARASLVVNLAGVLHARGRGFDAVHARGAGALAARAAAAGCPRLVHVSAVGADPRSPSRYARSKAEGERLVLEAFPSAVVARPSVVFGEGDGFVQRFASDLRTLPFFPLIGGGATRFQPVLADDLAEALARAGADPEESLPDGLRGAAWEFGGAEVIDMKTLLESILRLCGRRRALVPVPFGIASALAAPLALLPRPPLTPDQVTLLRRDAVAAPGRDGFALLGMEPDGLSFHLPRLVAGRARPYAPAWEFR